MVIRKGRFMKTTFFILVSLLFLVSMVFGDDKEQPASKSGEKDQLSEKPKAEKPKYEKRKANNPEIAIETDFGTMKLELFRDVAPIHVDSMLARIREGFYDSLTFHRVIDNFMIQGGDPKGNGTGNAGYYLPAEFSKLPHVEGTLSMARAQNPNSASCQFFICLVKYPSLDGQYTVFGHLMEGYDVLHKIGKVETDQMDKPIKTAYIKKMRILNDVEENQGKSDKDK